VFAGVGPEDIRPIRTPDPAGISRAAIRRAARSVVKITGEARSCSRGQEGSGAVVAAERVVTNAHVVAGVRRPFVQVGGVGRRYPAAVVEFDPRRDLAVLAVPGLDAPALGLGSQLQRGDSAVVAGFPRNGPFTAGAARVRSQLRAVGEDIYGRPGATRQVYSLYADVEPGNSGGPLLSPAGRLVGIVFAKSLDDADTGYALTLAEARSTIEEGIRADSQAGTGSCAAA
jgi:S1-C subfamily serine protease